MRSAFDSGRLTFRSSTPTPVELVGKCQHRALDDRRSGRLASPGRADAGCRVGGTRPGDRSAGSAVALEPGGLRRLTRANHRYANAYDFFNVMACSPGGPARHWRGLWFQSNLPGQVAPAPTAVGIAPIFHGRSTVRSIRYELCQRTNTATVCRRMRHPRDRRTADGTHRRENKPNY